MLTEEQFKKMSIKDIIKYFVNNGLSDDLIYEIHYNQ